MFMTVDRPCNNHFGIPECKRHHDSTHSLTHSLNPLNGKLRPGALADLFPEFQRIIMLLGRKLTTFVTTAVPTG
jgi:hypothetical protein